MGLSTYKTVINDAYSSPAPPFSAKLLRKHFVYCLTSLPESYQPAEITHIRVIKRQSPFVPGQSLKIVVQITQGGIDIDVLRYKSQNATIGCHTNYIERLHFTQRRHSAVLQRKSSTVTHDDSCLQEQLTLERFYYNFMLPHRSLREKVHEGQKC